MSRYDGYHISKPLDYSTDGDSAFLGVYLNGENTARYFKSFKFVSSDLEAEPYVMEASFMNRIDIPIANISTHPALGEKVTLTLIATTELEGNPEYTLGTIEVEIN